jgi:hypothetical protein
MKPSVVPTLVRPLAWITLGLVTAFPGEALAQSSQTREVVNAARRALGWDTFAASQGAVRVEGKARFLGSDAAQTILFDGRGRFVQTFEGPLRQSNGTDGHTTWVRDWTETPRKLVLGDLSSSEVSTLFLTGGWTVSEDRFDFELAAEQAAGEISLAFTHSDGVLTGTIHLDATTRRARSVTFGSDASPTVWTFADYEDHDGFYFPRRIELVQGGLAQGLTTGTVTRLAAVDEASFAPRLAAPGDTRFDTTVPAKLEVKAVASGHLLVHPLVNGKDLGWFIFDTGAGINCISNAVTDGLEGPLGEIGARGIGGTVPSRLWRAKELRLGPLTVNTPVFMGLDLAFLEPHFGVPVAGILGFELLARCVVEVDMDADSISLFDPATYALPDPGRWEEALLYGRQPCVRARFEEREGVFKIDTGAADDTVTFHYQVVKDLELTKDRATKPGKAGGVGGTVTTLVGELASFTLGGHEFLALPASFTLEDKGAFSDDYVWGNIGGKLLEPFRIAFDYPSGRLGFIPREQR